jgi:hypothetical protein
MCVAGVDRRLVERGDRAERADPSGAIGRADDLARDVGGDRREPEPQPALRGDGAHERRRRGEMRCGAGCAGRADEQRHAEPPRGLEHEGEIASGHLGRRRHLAAAEIGGSGIDRPHVGADEMRAAGDARAQRRLGDAVAELARRGEDAQLAASSCGRQTGAQALERAHNAMSSRGPCCCAP